MEDLVAEKKYFLSELNSIAAASAGYGDGLCEIYTNTYECAKEKYAPYLEILQLDHSKHPLTAALGGANTVKRSYCGNAFVDLGLGNGRLLVEGSNEEDQWHRVKKRFRDFARSSRLDSPMLTEEIAFDSRFIEATKNALSAPELPLGFDTQNGKILELEEFFLFATSMGAAELAKRRLEGIAHCWLPAECREKRDA